LSRSIRSVLSRIRKNNPSPVLPGALLLDVDAALKFIRGMFTFFKNYFQKKSLRDFEEAVSRINEHEENIKKLSDEEIRVKSEALKQKVREASSEGNEEEVENVKIEAFALAREAAWRTLGKRPYDVQLVGGLVLHRGAIAEMATGEGKTLAAVAPAYFNALFGNGVHIVTVNEYLARRDAVWMGQIYHFLGLTVACITPQGAFRYDPQWHIPEEGQKLADQERDTTGAFLVQQEYLRPASRREAYLADITYGTNHEFGFDYLRDNLSYSIENRSQREHNFAIIDEVDSILIDEARTPLIIAAPDSESSEYYKTFARVVSRLNPEEHYVVDEKLKNVSITEAGIEKVEELSAVRDLYAPENLRFVHYLEESLKARALFKKDKDYVVKNGEIIIVDEFTGRMLVGRRYNGGLHQAIEAKENVQVKEESRTYAKISIQNYFRMYEKISGMTGTAQTSAEEFHKVYGLDVFTIPTNKPSVRADRADKIYKNIDAKFDAIIKDIRERRERGQPVLVGTTSIAKNELLSSKLTKAGIPHELLNAKNNEREGAIIAQAGSAKAVTVATNVAGRGVDIILGGNPPDTAQMEKVLELGGLYVVGTERHEARRIDNQLRGRSGRQGDPGETQFFLSLDDDLLRIFGGDRIKGLMERFNLPEDEPIQLGFVSSAVAEAQAKVEGANFDMRKHLLEYDDVLNKQRTAVYATRQNILSALNFEDLGKIIFDAVWGHFEQMAHGKYPSIARVSEGEEIAEDETRDPEQLAAEHLKRALLENKIVEDESILPERIEVQTASWNDVEEILRKRSLEIAHNPKVGNFLLSMLDMLWMTNLDDLEALQESVNLRSYGQHDPLVEFKREASGLYKKFWVNFNEWVFVNIFKLALATENQGGVGSIQSAAPTLIMPTLSSSSGGGNVPSRNSPCPCGSGRKYKKCGLLNTEEHKKLMAQKV
jgi:preprotein translocase subunit SecA